MEKITVSLSVDFHGRANQINKTLEIEKGKTAFDLLKMNADVDYKTYAGMGVFITTINNVSLNNEWYWIIFANGKAISVAADKFLLNNSDAIEFRYMNAKDSKKFFPGQ